MARTSANAYTNPACQFSCQLAEAFTLCILAKLAPHNTSNIPASPLCSHCNVQISADTIPPQSQYTRQKHSNSTVSPSTGPLLNRMRCQRQTIIHLTFTQGAYFRKYVEYKRHLHLETFAPILVGSYRFTRKSTWTLPIPTCEDWAFHVRFFRQNRILTLHLHSPMRLPTVKAPYEKFLLKLIL